MRFGRSLATVGATALVAVGALASPAAADDGSGFAIDDSYAGRYASGQSATVSGVGCNPVNGNRSALVWGLTRDGVAIEGANGAEAANADGTWKTTIDLPAIAAGADLKDPSALRLGVACVDYNGNVAGTAEVPLYIDSTAVDGTATIVSSDTDSDGKYDTQTFEINLTGFTPGETVKFFVSDENGNSTKDIREVTADAEGRFAYNGPVPTDLPDGKYRIVIWNATYDEGFISEAIQVTGGWWQVKDGAIPSDPNNPTPTADPSAAADPATDGDPGATAPTAPKSGLAKTGTSLSVAVVAAGLLAAGGVLLVHRRRA